MRRCFLPSSALGLVALLFSQSATAQTTTGSIQGAVTDATTGFPMLLVTVIASSPKLQGQAMELTDATGQYLLANLAPGPYSVLFIYADAKVRRDNVEVSTGKVTPVNVKIDQQTTEVVTIKERPPAIDVGSTKQGTTVQQDYLKNVPNRGRTYDRILGTAAGAQDDRYGTSFSGSTSVENSHVVDGVNTTGVKYGDVQSPVLNNFIQEIEIITGGYNAEFGRSTGGVVNVVTKTGSNEFHGSVWANVTPFEAKRAAVQSANSPFRGDRSLDADLDFGFDVGGPIIKDRLWFYVGFAPFIQRTKTTRVVSTQVDRRRRFYDYSNPSCSQNNDRTCDADGNPATSSAPGCELTRTCESDGTADLDASNSPIFEEIDRSSFVSSQTRFQFTGKLNFAVSPDHQGQISFVGTPGSYHRMLPGAGSSPVLPCVFGTPSACQNDITELTADAAFKWTSKLNDNKTQIDAVLGWHRWSQSIKGTTDHFPNSPDADPVNEPSVTIVGGDVNGTDIGIAHNWDTNESDRVFTFCKDEPVTPTIDQFPGIRNCPYNFYHLGGVGFRNEEVEKRVTAKVTLTQRVKALGHHQFKVGADVEINQVSVLGRNSGGRTYAYNLELGIRSWLSIDYARPDRNGPDVCGFKDDNSPIRCFLLRDVQVDATTFNWSAFIQDSWSILPNLTINAGLRYEEQRIGYADQQQDNIDPLTKERIGSTALKLSGLFAPRLGVIYDPTREGRSKIYASWGRFYESVPMDLNELAFGGESSVWQYWAAYPSDGSPCLAFTPGPNAPTLPTDPRTCPRSANMDGTNSPLLSYQLLFGDPTAGVPVGVSLVVPGTQAQSMDEIVVGAEYEVLEDLRVALSYQNRRMNTVIEDMSTDGGNTYYFGNPGTFSSGEEQAMLDRIMREQDSDIRNALIKRLTDFRRIRGFDKPVRDYNAVQLTVSKRFARNFMVQGSYTWSRLRGNYPGLFQPETGQLAPNLTSQYDLPELLGNRFGLLPGDRTHQIKIDGYYTFDLEKAGRVTTGLRLRAQSGVLNEVIGASRVYGYTESWILPRDISGRSAFSATADVHVAYARRVGDIDLEVYFDLFNLFNNQYETSRDSRYTLNNVAPIIGGDASDLAHAKAYTFRSQGVPVVKNLNWGHSFGRADPLTGRFGVTIAF